jgi:GNAT superfamily N-acetyltransferase
VSPNAFGQLSKEERQIRDFANAELMKHAPKQFAISGVAHDDPTALRLLELLQAEYVGLYGLVDPDPGADLHTARQPDGDILLLFPNETGSNAQGIVAWTKLDDTTAVMHRMYVHFNHRGKGYSKILLAAVESSARQAGMKRMLLETGTVQTVAISLYEGARYERVEPFGFYGTGAAADWTTSVFMGKDIAL